MNLLNNKQANNEQANTSQDETLSTALHFFYRRQGRDWIIAIMWILW